MASVLRVVSTVAQAVELTTMHEKNFLETQHLESWIVQHPEVLGSDLMIVATQFDEWEAETGAAHDRPDILALSSSGQLVVIELKRGGDRRVHLQVLTYGALAAKFDLDRLGRAHRRWLRKSRDDVTEEQARQALIDHVDGDWRDDVLQIPKLIVVSETYPPQVLTTVGWLSEIAPSLVLECYEFSLFSDDGRTYVTFSRLFPVDDLSDRILRPAPRVTSDAAEEIAARTRRATSVKIIHEQHLISVGAPVSLELDGAVRPEVVKAVQDWLGEDPARTRVVWADHPSAPLRWDGESDPTREWTLSRLRDHIFEQAGEVARSSAADMWHVNGRSIYWIAQHWIERQTD